MAKYFNKHFNICDITYTVHNGMVIITSIRVIASFVTGHQKYFDLKFYICNIHNLKVLVL